MACRTETTQIDGRSVVVTQWPVTTALLFKMRFAKIVGPAMSALQHINVEDMAQLESVFAEAVSKIFESDNSDPELIVNYMKDVLTSGGVHVDGEAVSEAKYIELFSGDGMGLMYKVLFFVLKTNFGDLIGGRSQKGKVTAKSKALAEQDTQT